MGVVIAVRGMLGLGFLSLVNESENERRVFDLALSIIRRLLSRKLLLLLIFWISLPLDGEFFHVYSAIKTIAKE